MTATTQNKPSRWVVRAQRAVLAVLAHRGAKAGAYRVLTAFLRAHREPTKEEQVLISAFDWGSAYSDSLDLDEIAGELDRPGVDRNLPCVLFPNVLDQPVHPSGEGEVVIVTDRVTERTVCVTMEQGAAVVGRVRAMRLSACLFDCTWPRVVFVPVPDSGDRIHGVRADLFIVDDLAEVEPC